ncbi:MAG: lysylphosphatidylglycerol synthase transmembrane domain-containing protein [Thermoguttaceae bacterium]
MHPSKSNQKKWLKTAVKLLVVVIVLWAIRGTLLDAWDQMGQYEWHLEPKWLAIAGGLYLLGLLPAGLFWHRVLRVLGQEAGLGETLRAYFIGHLGKYVPGKAMVVVLRTGLIRSHRVDTGIAAVSVFFETLTMMAVGACIAAGIIAAKLRDQQLYLYGAIGLMLLAGLPTLPPIFRRLVRLARVGKSDPTTGERLEKLGYGTLALGWVAMGLVWVMLGLSLWATFRATGIHHLGPIEHLSSYTAAVSLAMVAGFLSLIPGGLGVRDGILIKLIVLFFLVSEAQAVVAGALLRLVWLVSEVIISVILYSVGSRPPAPPPKER